MTDDVLRLRADGAAASVRPATAADCPAIGAVQFRAWQGYGALLPAGALAAASPARLADAWRAALETSAAGGQLLVACAGTTVVGFAAIAAATDPDAEDGDGELRALEVDPAHRRAGHGSRLLTAAIDALQRNDFHTVRCWVAVDDEPRRAFLASAGLGPDGARREYQDGDRTLTVARLVAGLDAPEAAP